MAKFYADENFNLRAVAFLKNLGHDVLTPHDTGKANQGIPDDEVFEFARAIHRVILTFDRKDYIKLHRENPVHSGIVVCSQDSDFLALSHRIDEAFTALEAAGGNLENQLLRIYLPNPSLKK